ncbi:hypothetical protein CQA49_00005, partial [Helicobacter sp. MIT 00-7814]
LFSAHARKILETKALSQTERQELVNLSNEYLKEFPLAIEGKSDKMSGIVESFNNALEKYKSYADKAKENPLVKDMKIQKIDFEQALKQINTITPASMPQKLDEKELLEGFQSFVNIEDFLKHLHKKEDSRIKYLKLAQPTYDLPDLTLTKGDKISYLKAFKNYNKTLFYMLITREKDKLLISGYPINKIGEVRRILRNADGIYNGRATDTLATASEKGVSSLGSNSTIKEQNKQGFD